MDLQSANRLSGRKWQIARFGAVVFFALACGLLVSSLLNPSRAGLTEHPTSRLQSL
ncbi:MAG: hypothetical protein AB7O57_02300 [Hyphomicrobiaceae bacterium]